jgi:DNA modification methylase
MKRQSKRVPARAHSASTIGAGHNQLPTIEYVPVAGLKQDPRDPHRISDRDVAAIVPSVVEFENELPPLLVAGSYVSFGWQFVLAAREARITHLRCVRVDGLSEARRLALSVACNRALSRGGFDGDALLALLPEFDVEFEDFDPGVIGFSMGELDSLLSIGEEASGIVEDDPGPPERVPISRLGEIYSLGNHRLLVGDATKPDDHARLMAGRMARAASNDPPYGCKVDGFVSKKGRHPEFKMMSGEQSDAELLEFFDTVAGNVSADLEPGSPAIFYIDWRKQYVLQTAMQKHYELLNTAVYVKNQMGMGSYLRSQHELAFIYKKPGAKHRNNVELGRHGRNRSNVWQYPSAMASRGGPEGDLLKDHPTPKPVAMIADSIMDCTKRGDIVLDCFLGSGTTLIAAERTGRLCYGMEIEPIYADLSIRRWQRWTKRRAYRECDGRPFDEIETERLQQLEADDDR